MNVKKLSISIIIVMLLINIMFFPKIFAISEIIKAGDDFLDAGDNPEDNIIDTDNIKSTSSKIYNILLLSGIGVTVIVGAILGISFILSSAEGKAKISEALVPYIVGCFVVFGAFTIWKTAINVGNRIIATSEETPTGQTPPAVGYVCPECKLDLGEIPANVVVGGRTWACPHCNKQITPQPTSGCFCSICNRDLELKGTEKDKAILGGYPVYCKYCKKQVDIKTN